MEFRPSHQKRNLLADLLALRSGSGIAGIGGATLLSALWRVTDGRLESELTTARHDCHASSNATKRESRSEEM
jgi:hypothetical protein